MAHTLKLYDGIEGTTLDLAATATTGYHLMRYPFASAPELDVRATSSQFADGELPYYDRKSNITEEITIEIIGSSADDLWVKVRALQRAFEHARDYYKAPGIRTPVYLEFKPNGTTNSGYSTVTGGQLILPDLYAAIDDENETEAQLLANTIIGAVLRIEREPFWRAYAPVPSATITNWAAAYSLTASPAAPTGFVAYDITTSIGGDMPALMRIAHDNVGDNLTDVYIGIRSKNKHGTAYKFGRAGLWGMLTGTDANPYSAYGADTAAAADATAYGTPDGPTAGTKRIRCTFATDQSLEIRATPDTASMGVVDGGDFRIFVRAKVATGTATVVLTTAFGNFTKTITATAWTWHDFGVYQVPGRPQGLKTLSASRIGSFNILASGASGVNLDLDLIAFMPIDEYYLAANGVSANDVIDNTAPVQVGLANEDFTGASTTYGRGNLLLPVGDCMIYILSDDVTTYPALTLHYVQRYSAPRGNG